MVMIEKDVFCLFNRVEQEKILSPPVHVYATVNQIFGTAHDNDDDID